MTETSSTLLTRFVLNAFEVSKGNRPVSTILLLSGNIARNSPAARYLTNRGVIPKDFNSYGSRRGHDVVMKNGTFANIRLVNKLVSKPGPRTVHFPSGEELDIPDAADKYIAERVPTIILTGKEYGSGSSRDWAAKGPLLLVRDKFSTFF